MAQYHLTARNAIAGIISGVCLAIPLSSVSIFFSASKSAAQGINSVQQPAAQTTSPSLNPCPNIYYEEPFNSTRLVPQGCPPNAATQNQQGAQPMNSSSPAPNSSSTNPSSTNPSSTSTQPTSPATASSPNPCPSIYYEEPFNSTRLVPPGCPANAATQNQGGQVPQ